jgi:RNA polymerase sigma factor (TIGR02999 family)
MTPVWDKQQFDDLYSRIYEELRQLARGVLRHDRAAQLSPTTLVHEAWVKLSKAPVLASLSRPHFQHLAARAMRQVLIDAIRHNGAAVHGGAFVHVSFDHALDPGAPVTERAFEALHSALDRLAELHPRQASVVEARYFGGLTVAECAELLGVSEETVARDWRVARAWLENEIRQTLHPVVSRKEDKNGKGGSRDAS